MLAYLADLALLAQVDSNPDTPASVLAAVIWLGSIVVGGLGITVRTLYKDGKVKDLAIEALRAENALQLQQQLRESLRVLMDATARIADSEKAVEASTVMFHTLQGRQIPAEQLTEIAYHLRALRERPS